MIKALLIAEELAELAELWHASIKLSPSKISSALPETLINDPQLRRFRLSEAVPIPPLSETPPDGTIELIKMAVEKLESTVIIAPSTRAGRELVARVAQKMAAGCVTDCTNLVIEDGRLVAERPALGGAYVERLEVLKLPVFIALQLRGAETGIPQENQDFAVLSVKPVEGARRVPRIVSTERATRGGADLTKAKRIVAVGRGFKRRDDLAMAEDLARLLDAELACSRPVASDLKWLPEDRHVGLSGKWVSPDLYLAIGISGQVQHMVGVRNSKIIVAVNNDPAAPIHREADYSVLLDLYSFIPELIKLLGERRGGTA